MGSVLRGIQLLDDFGQVRINLSSIRTRDENVGERLIFTYS
jgi:hypothetical protein